MRPEAILEIEHPDAANQWRTESPGVESWKRSVRPGASTKPRIISADGHVQEPSDLWESRLDRRFRDRLPSAKPTPGVKVEAAFRATRSDANPLEGLDLLRSSSGRTPAERLVELDIDGVDGEILFPNKGLIMWATPDPEFADAMCAVYNDWAWETYADYQTALIPMACIATADVALAVREIQRCADLGFKGLCLPCKPKWGPPDADDPNYNLREYDPLWDCIDDVDLPVTFHVSTGRDPRTARSNGGAIINYTIHSLAPTLEPLVNICASGVAERHPRLRFGSVEAGIGWLPWLLEAMDEAFRKHHMWVRPKLEALPSEYFRRGGFATFQEDLAGISLLREFDLVENVMWASDFPHHEGTWPYSAAAIERTMGGLSDDDRVKVLGENVTRIFGLPTPNEPGTTDATRGPGR